MSHWNKTLGIVLGLMVASCSNNPSQSADSNVEEKASAISLVDASSASKLLEEDKTAVLLDVRTPEEFNAGHIDGAENIDFKSPDFVDKIGNLAKDKHYVVYCGSGKRSGKATAKMDELGFTKITDVDGGITAWSAANLPLVQ
ncbi:hypothetical protein MNBD_ALPHA04-11 [hydrothermal vent metagenome]|uniref:Rhodanese domain-containing protein n=1 Tax=hydrothermal vent metagenome TaxID=652676 RepID=A0A3B0SDA0_9ZZZZ